MPYPGKHFATQAIAEAHLDRIIARADREKVNHRSALYFIAAAEGPVKIGHTSNIAKRLAAIQSHSPVALSVLAMIESRGVELERIYHARFAAYRLHGEWFERCPEIEAEIERLNPSWIK